MGISIKFFSVFCEPNTRLSKEELKMGSIDADAHVVECEATFDF